MSTHLAGFLSFFIFLHHFILEKFATSSIRVNPAVLEVLQWSAIDTFGIEEVSWHLRYERIMF